jgi:hypothetical protein
MDKIMQLFGFQYFKIQCNLYRKYSSIHYLPQIRKTVSLYKIMKNIANLFLASILLLSGFCTSQAQEGKQTIRKSFSPETGTSTPIVIIKNIMGDVTVEGYSGKTVEMVVEEEYTAKNEADKAKMKSRIGLVTRVSGDTIEIKIDCLNKKPECDCGCNWNDDHIDGRFHHDMTIKVPSTAKVKASTVNDGEMLVTGVKHVIAANNVNGNVKVEKAAQVEHAATVNGSVNVELTEQPAQVLSCKTINGEITILAPAKMGASISFKSMHGDFYTDFDDTKAMPSKVQTTQDRKNNKAKYVLEDKTAVQLNQGGPAIELETLNGDMYVKKRS